jgi:hypothetical protein
MPIQIVWDNDDRTIMRFLFEDPWDATELFNAITQTKTLLAAEDIGYAVGVIFDTQATGSLPSGILTSTRTLVEKMSPEIAIIVVATRNRFLRAMHQVFSRVNRSLAEKFQLAGTVEEARVIITGRVKKRDALRPSKL